jgi:hypothetical protein
MPEALSRVCVDGRQLAAIIHGTRYPGPRGITDSTGNRIKTWYRASEANCAGGSGTCSVTPGTALAQGAGRWWVQTWNPVGYGPWSAAKPFTVQSSIALN